MNATVFDPTSNAFHSVYSYIFDSEYRPKLAKQWFAERTNCTYLICFIYLIIVFGIKKFMENKKPLKLKPLLVVWNTSFAIFSLVTFVKIAPEFFRSLFGHGLYHSVCVSSCLEENYTSGFWICLFGMSKVVELGDTLFIVLRKQRLLFLHWYHHITALTFSWYGMKEFTPMARWITIMNSFIHMQMYAYYAFSTMGYKAPKYISIFITSIQISQMILGFLIGYWAYSYTEAGFPCQSPNWFNIFDMCLYGSYWILFSKFFYTSYIAKKPRSKQQ